MEAAARPSVVRRPSLGWRIASGAAAFVVGVNVGAILATCWSPLAVLLARLVPSSVPSLASLGFLALAPLMAGLLCFGRRHPERARSHEMAVFLTAMFFAFAFCEAWSVAFVGGFP